MCYAKPGPRCSNHALKTLSNARAAWDEAQTDVERSIAMTTLKEAREQYDTTPIGQRDLKYEIRRGRDPDGLLSARLEHGIAKRKSMLEAIKSEDKGDVVKEEEDLNNAILFRGDPARSEPWIGKWETLKEAEVRNRAILEHGDPKRKLMLEAIKPEDKLLQDVDEPAVPEYTIVDAAPVTLAGTEYSVQVQTQANGRQTVWLTGPRGGVFFLREYLRNDSGERQVISYKSGQPLRVRGNEIHVTQTESGIEQGQWGVY